MLGKEVIDDNAHVGGNEFRFFGAIGLGDGGVGDDIVLQVQDADVALRALHVFADDVFALLDGADDGGIGGGTANAELLELMHQGGLVVALGCGGVAFGSCYLLCREDIANGEGRQHSGAFLCGVVLIRRFAIDAQKAVEGDDFARRCEKLFRPFHGHGDGCLLQLSIGHLRS